MLLKLVNDRKKNYVFSLIDDFVKNYYFMVWEDDIRNDNFMKFPRMFYQAILNYGKIDEEILNFIFEQVPESLYPYIDPIDRQYAINVKSGKTISEARNSILKDEPLIFFTPLLFLRAYPFLLLNPQNNMKKMEEVTCDLIAQTHGSEVGRIVSFYNLINIEFENELTFIDDLIDYIRNKNRRISYLFSIDEEDNLKINDNAKFIYTLLNIASYIRMDSSLFERCNEVVGPSLKRGILLSVNLYFKNFGQIPPEFNSRIKKEVKVIRSWL